MSIENELEQNETSPLLQPGTLLKQKREQLGLSQKQIADRLRLRLAIIQNIEDNNFEDGQVATFTRGYLRSYAKAVGLNETEVLGALDVSGGVKPQDHEMQSFSRKTNKEKHDSRIMLLTWGIFAIIIGISSVWWWQNQKNDDLAAEKLNSAAQTQTPASAAGEESPTTTDFTSLEALEDAEDQQIETQASAAEDSTEEPAADAEQPADEVAEIQEPTEPEAAEPATPAVAENHLVMSFDADCWIQVKDASGKTLATGVKKAGQSVELLGTKPYRVVLGAPENVSMTLASEPVDLSGYTSGKVARFTLP
ncbi:cytoskeleton protein RodZ [Vibrio xiamenensis]|uniref:Cytoskeleton protein RodZ n=1 Tax=Vibrio xiamenensis TaxID=861298 RepID=A0A1G7W587_9VIBR|nr:RodZ domain-containing protein [Vibrio xiamenensis]SDG67144.1 cytoskeleton protein RodZ [Vibrio xiamenensis]